MRVVCLLDRRPHPMPTPLLEAVFARLERRGLHVDWMIPEEQLLRPDELVPDYDVYLLKSQSELALSLAEILHAQGARIVNPYPASAAVRDKVLTAYRLRAAGIPSPRTWVTSDVRLIETLLDDGPLVLKPPRGLHGEGVRVVRDPGAVAGIAAPDGPLLVQRYVPGPPEDLKLYVIAGEVFGVRKPFSDDSFSDEGRRCDVPPAAREVALLCGEAFGLELFGVDLIEAVDGPVVVDVNYFPGYRGIPEAEALLVDHVERAATA